MLKYIFVLVAQTIAATGPAAGAGGNQPQPGLVGTPGSAATGGGGPNMAAAGGGQAQSAGAANSYNSAANFSQQHSQVGEMKSVKICHFACMPFLSRAVYGNLKTTVKCRNVFIVIKHTLIGTAQWWPFLKSKIEFFLLNDWRDCLKWFKLFLIRIH